MISKATSTAPEGDAEARPALELLQLRRRPLAGRVGPRLIHRQRRRGRGGSLRARNRLPRANLTPLRGVRMNDGRRDAQGTTQQQSPQLAHAHHVRSPHEIDRRERPKTTPGCGAGHCAHARRPFARIDGPTPTPRADARRGRTISGLRRPFPDRSFRTHKASDSLTSVARRRLHVPPGAGSSKIHLGIPHRRTERRSGRSARRSTKGGGVRNSCGGGASHRAPRRPRRGCQR
jgi:hypothetical protein